MSGVVGDQPSRRTGGQQEVVEALVERPWTDRGRRLGPDTEQGPYGCSGEQQALQDEREYVEEHRDDGEELGDDVHRHSMRAPSMRTTTAHSHPLPAA